MKTFKIKMHKISGRISLALGFCFAFSNVTICQDKIDPVSRKEAVLSFFQLQNIRFEIPRNYNELTSYEDFKCGDGKLTSPPMYPLSNKDTSIVIAFAIYYPTSKESLEMIHSINPQYDPSGQWLGTTAYLADTASFPLTFLRTKYLKKLNADSGAQFVRNCNRPFLEKTFQNRIVFLDKNGRGQLAIIFLFDKSKESIIDKEIKRTMKRMIYYNN